MASEENCESIFDNIGVICIFGEIVKNKLLTHYHKATVWISADLSLKYNSFGHLNLNFFKLFLTAVISDGGRRYQTHIWKETTQELFQANLD